MHVRANLGRRRRPRHRLWGGMRAKEARAFDRFGRFEGSSADGSGSPDNVPLCLALLGLAIPAQFVHVSGGTCWLATDPAGGIEAVIRLRVTR